MFIVTDDTIRAVFSAEEIGLLRQIPWILDEVARGEGDPGYGVLHRPVYPDDPAASHELSGLVAAETDQRRGCDRSVVRRIGDGETTMTWEEAHGLLRAVNEARLVLAARAGAFDDGAVWEESISRDPTLAAVAWLGYLQGELMQALKR